MDTDKVNKSYKIYSSKFEWAFAISLGIVCMILYEYFGWNFYTFYIYFYVAGILSFLSFIVGWGTILPEGLLIRFGLLRSRKLFIDWEEINNIGIMYVKKKLFIRFGGGFAIPTKDDIGIKTLGIELIQPISEERRNFFERISRRTLFSQQFEYDCEKNTLFLFNEPPCGFKLISNYSTKLKKIKKSQENA